VIAAIACCSGRLDLRRSSAWKSPKRPAVIQIVALDGRGLANPRDAARRPATRILPLSAKSLRRHQDAAFFFHHASIRSPRARRDANRFTGVARRSTINAQLQEPFRPRATSARKRQSRARLAAHKYSKGGDPELYLNRLFRPRLRVERAQPIFFVFFFFLGNRMVGDAGGIPLWRLSNRRRGSRRRRNSTGADGAPSWCSPMSEAALIKDDAPSRDDASAASSCSPWR